VREHGQEQLDSKTEQLERILKSRAKNNQIGCQTALEIASEVGVSPAVLGTVLDRLKIRITRCQLGCF
jgi:DNA-binding IscR family transcriptional regulator